MDLFVCITTVQVRDRITGYPPHGNGCGLVFSSIQSLGFAVSASVMTLPGILPG